MRRIVGLAALAILIVMIVLVAAAKLRYAGTPTMKLADDDCDREMWKHVYEPGRLHVIEACTAVEGRVASVHRASDGDLHIGLDPDQKSALNFINAMHAQRRLVVEIICDHMPGGVEEKTACGDFHPAITIPKLGDRVRVTGAYVTDRDNGWNEIHPVTRIEILH